jgi:mRNA interferase MazF
MYKQGEIILTEIKFTDTESAKKRPALVISNNYYNEKYNEILVIPMTSNYVREGVVVSNEDMKSGELRYPSVARIDRIVSVDKAKIVKSLGFIKDTVYDKIISVVSKFIERISI